MEMKPVEKSSNIKSIGYDADSKKMRVDFGKGCYEYSDVPERIHRELSSAESKGGYFAKNVRGQFSVQKLTGEW